MATERPSGPSPKHVAGRGLPGRTQTSILQAIGLGVGGLFRNLLRIERSPWDNPWKPNVDHPPTLRGRRGHLTATLEALLDTTLPGPTTDPESLPGAVESGALELLLDPPMLTVYGRKLPTRPFLWSLVLVTDTFSLLRKGRPYRFLAPRGRFKLLLELLHWMPLLYDPVVSAARYAFLGGPVNRRGLEALGDPGPIDRHPPHLDFDPTEMPTPATRSGNLP